MSGASQPRRVSTWVTLGLLVLLAAGLRFYALGEQSLWHDESMTWLRVIVPWDTVPEMLRNSPNLPTSYLLIKPVIDVFGASEFWLRFVSAAFGVLAVPAAWKIGREAGGRPGGWVAAWAWAVHPMLVFFAQDAKTYGVTSGLAALLLALHLHMRRQRRTWHWLAAGLVLTAGLLSHYYFFFVAALLVLSAARQLRSEPAFFRGWTMLTVVAIVPLLLRVAWFYALEEPMLGNGWIDLPSVKDPLLTLWNLLSGFGGQTSWQSLAIGAVLGTFTLAALVFAKQRRELLAVFALAVMAPTLVMIVVSLRKPLYMDRYFIVLLPFLLFIVAGGAGFLWQWVTARLAPNASRQLAVWLFVLSLPLGLWIGSSVHTQAHYVKEDWRSMVGYLKEQDEPRLLNPDLAPLFYYGLQPQAAEPGCWEACWLILYRPYMPAHEFTNSIQHPDRPWLPELDPECQLLDEWFSPTNVGLWKFQCN